MTSFGRSQAKWRLCMVRGRLKVSGRAHGTARGVIDSFFLKKGVIGV